VLLSGPESERGFSSMGNVAENPAPGGVISTASAA